MTEEISQVYENVDLKAWAQQIRENKIAEFQEIINNRQKDGNNYLAMDLSKYTLPQAIDEIAKGLVIAADLIRMELKLQMLKKA